MSQDIIYADLDVGDRRRTLDSRPQPGRKRIQQDPTAPGCPWWHQTALWAGWIGNVLLGVAVVALGCLCLPHQLETPGSPKNESRNLGDGLTTLDNFRQELRKGLSSSSEGGSCQLCPANWTLWRSKCFWFSTKWSSWNSSLWECREQGAELLLPGDWEELNFLNQTLQAFWINFWIGLFFESGGKGWIWINGSRLDQHQFPLNWNGEKTCGILRGNKIESNKCENKHRWICQKNITWI